MKTSLMLLAATSAFAWASCSSTTSEGSDNDTTVVMNMDAPAAGTRSVRTQLSESDSYIDLRTGQPLRIRMGETGLYTAETGDLDLYVNTTTGDTFYRGEAYPVSGHVMRDAGGAYSIDQMWFDTEYSGGNMSSASGAELPVTGDAEKVRTEEDGDYKMKNKDGDVKEKLKVDGDGKDVKYKYKDDATDTKVKMTEDQIKIKDKTGKTEIESDGSVKQKPR